MNTLRYLLFVILYLLDCFEIHCGNLKSKVHIILKKNCDFLVIIAQDPTSESLRMREPLFKSFRFAFDFDLN